ncbi:hypothetical protein DPEC_G00172340 [Dallia pectoralis]|uniref:Uncharacterized protein n=1 Tax=Dallia pectoralis TaxID=75939 RepID=A0ACC2GDW6_DALPE|nr:hypothetical protein DPEC_G00172340 [Dallia pectoralis]
MEFLEYKKRRRTQKPVPTNSTHLAMSYVLPSRDVGSLEPELRLVLLGTIGCGKTLTGDTLLGTPPSSYASVSSSSRLCQVRRGMSAGRRLTVVEAPRWYWSGGHMEDDVRKETERALDLCAPGPHVFLLLVPVGQFTEVEQRVPAELEEVFGKGVLDHTLVLLTCGDYLMGKEVGHYLEREDPGLREVIDRCGGQYHVINNRRSQERDQVRELLEKVENMVQKKSKSSTERRMEEMQKRIEDNRRQMEAEKEMSDETVRRSGSEGMGQRRDETENRRELMEERVTAKPVAKSLYSTPRPHQQPSEPQNGGPPVFTRTPSFNLNKEGALLSQLSEVKPEQTKKVVNTIYHRVNSFEMDTASSQRSSSTSPLVSTDSSHFSPLFSPGPPSFAELRMVMIGRSGSGKSAAGNVLLGRREFVSLSDSSAPVTQDCQKGRAIVAGRQVAVVDTPDWFNSDAPQELVHSQLSSCVALTAPGPHAFLFCVPVDQPAHAELKALDALEKVFGPKAVRLHTLLLFTHADRLKGSGKASGGRVDEVEKYISTQRRDLLELVERCGDRYHVMEREARAGGGAKEQNRSVEELLEKVQRTVTEGGGGCYSCTLFQEAEDRVRQRQRELVRERRGAEGGERLSSPSMQPLTETEEEEVDQEVMERTREEAERSVAQMELKDLPTFYSPPSFLGSLWDTVGKVGAKTMGAIPRSVWGKETENLPSIPTAAQSSSSLPSSAQSSSSLPSSTQSSSFLRSVLEKVAAGASRIPKLTAAGGLLGAVLGVFLGGPVGGAVGATAGSVATEAARWKLSKNSPEKTGLNPGLERQMDKLLKTE